MNIDIINFARHAKPKEFRWFVGQQLPLWIQQMLLRSRAGDDPKRLIEELAEVCNVTLKTEVLP